MDMVRSYAPGPHVADAIHDRVRVLILGGTAEARRLADVLAPRVEIEVVTSAGGAASAFGGAEDLVAMLSDLRPDAVVDATHAYAQTISRYARRACAAAGIPRLRYERPGWAEQAGDDWRVADDLGAAVAMACDIGKRVFLSVGKVPPPLVAPFQEHWFLMRSGEPAAPMPANVRVIGGKGPFTRESETELLDGHRIDVVVAKVAGGSAAYAKIEAARELRLPVVMLKRPDPPAGPIAGSLGETLAWLDLLVEACQPEREA